MNVKTDIIARLLNNDPQAAYNNLCEGFKYLMGKILTSDLFN